MSCRHSVSTALITDGKMENAHSTSQPSWSILDSVKSGEQISWQHDIDVLLWGSQQRLRIVDFQVKSNHFCLNQVASKIA
jgi:hypothetical protein